jgi:glycosyltransferase EpsD
MPAKILYTATSDIHLKTFHFPYLKWFINEGYEVHVACENRGNIDLSFCHKIHYLPFKRNPFNPQNIDSFVTLKKIIDQHHYDLIHCHTPVVSVLTRIAAIEARKKGTKVLYTAHGYHFFKGAPIKMWLLYYPLEKILSRITDAIILINKEDYEITKAKFFNTYTHYINGIGVDTDKHNTLINFNINEYKNKIGINNEDIVLLYIAEFIKRKNHIFIINTTKELIKHVPSIKILFVGSGELMDKMKCVSNKKNLSNHILFMGWREDVASLSAISDIGISVSKQEGLGLGLLEEMYHGLPIVASQDRGHREMVVHGVNGFLYRQGDTDEFVSHIIELSNNQLLRKKMGEMSKIKSESFTIDKSLKKMTDIYKSILSTSL